eukprot:691550-Amphidinium_carterae.1
MLCSKVPLLLHSQKTKQLAIVLPSPLFTSRMRALGLLGLSAICQDCIAWNQSFRNCWDTVAAEG